MKDDLETKLIKAFEVWFRNAYVDFWNEANAPEELAGLAIKIIRKESES